MVNKICRIWKEEVREDVNESTSSRKSKRGGGGGGERQKELGLEVVY